MSALAKAIHGDETALDALLVPLSREMAATYKESVNNFIGALAEVTELPSKPRVRAKQFALLALLSQPYTLIDPVERLAKLCPDLDAFKTRTFLNSIRPYTSILGKNGLEVDEYVAKCILMFDMTG